MAFVPLAVTTTLQIFKSVVRLNTGTISIQESGLLEPMLNDIVHNAVVSVRNRLGAQLDHKYLTEAKSADSDITETSNLIDISTLDIHDTARMSLYDATHGPIPFKTAQEFDNLRTIYSATMLANALFARVANVKATNNKLQIETYRGSSRTTAGNLVLSYYRNPTKASADATKIDLPEELIPIAEDVATVKVFEWLKKVPPTEISQRVSSFNQAQSA